MDDAPRPALTHRIPSGTRDVLPDEMRELRAITDAVRGVFETAGYGEIVTPALEYESVIARGGGGASRPAYRLFDEQGNVLVLRSDMTIPIARVVATRYAQAEPPLRFWYLAAAYRGVHPQRGQPRELLQVGIELVGAPGPEGTAEALVVLLPGTGRHGAARLSGGGGRRVAVPDPPGPPRRLGGGAGAAAVRAGHPGPGGRRARALAPSRSTTTPRRPSCGCPRCAAARRSWTSRAPRALPPCTGCCRRRSPSG